MEKVLEIWAYLKMHGPAMIVIIGMLLTIAEAVVRLTPTEKDDGAVERIGKRLRQAFDVLVKVFPNLKKGGGTHPPVEIKK